MQERTLIVAITIEHITRALKALFSYNKKALSKTAERMTTNQRFHTAKPSTGLIVQSILTPIHTSNTPQTTIKGIESTRLSIS